MADLTPEVLNALVRLVNGETDLTELDDDTLFALGDTLRRGRQGLHEIVVELYRNRDYTFAQMAERWGVTESAASRWMKPPQPPGRRPRSPETADDETGDEAP